ncbi:DUF1707 SHOCT-like domain-containing protein [Nocardia carnea]|uniref:DUF1707 SHOCT-like domain-containing protein n=1 Tax=Nocardia carnea TaxID=37328 RepID=UPI002456F028|nr:DUF1707 domain-containing protein [Nocardia carnea]
MSELPGARITVGERERAMRELAEHLGAGRLTLADYEERAAAAAAAVTTPELARLFTDLPAAPAPPAPPADPAAGFAVMAGCAAAFALILALVFGGWLWLMLLVVVLVSAPLVPTAVRRRRAHGRA